jgi:hypothetical protein
MRSWRRFPLQSKGVGQRRGSAGRIVALEVAKAAGMEYCPAILTVD